VLWGETVTPRQSRRAANWYERAVGYLPSFISARVHLSEIYLDDGDLEGAEALLAPVVASGDPEVNWRLSQVLEAQSKRELSLHARTPVIAGEEGRYFRVAAHNEWDDVQ
jgi:FimV-like protein